MKGGIYGTGLVTYLEVQYAFVCGPKGINYTPDFGVTWEPISNENSGHSTFTKVKKVMRSAGQPGRDGKILKIRLKSAYGR